MLRNRYNVSIDERLYFWFNAIPGSSGKHSVTSKFCEANYHKTCIFCGVLDSLQLPVPNAYIVASGCSFYAAFRSPRNFLPLCGTLGRHPGSCRDFLCHFHFTRKSSHCTTSRTTPIQQIIGTDSNPLTCTIYKEERVQKSRKYTVLTIKRFTKSLFLYNNTLNNASNNMRLRFVNSN